MYFDGEAETEGRDESQGLQAVMGRYSDIEFLSALNSVIANQSLPIQPQTRSDQFCPRRFPWDIPALFVSHNVPRRLLTESVDYPLIGSPSFVETQ